MLSHSEKVLYWLWLTELPQVGNVTARMLWNHFGDMEAVYAASEESLRRVKGIRPKQIDILATRKDLQRAESVMESCKQLGIEILTLDMEEYPKRCCHIPEISPVLYSKGKNELNERSTVGIVGKRRCSEDCKQRTIVLAQQKCRQGFAVISGFAKGIDSYAHTAAIKCEGYTVGVLGNGLDVCYPKEQSRLKEVMEECGLLISSYPPGTMPKKYTFPVRNRLIAALSDQLYVMERGKISGTQSTIEAAECFGKEIYIQSV